MLVLGRKVDEEVYVEVPPSATPTRLKVVLVDIRGEKVRIGFDAPPGVSILRSELLPVPTPSRGT